MKTKIFSCLFISIISIPLLIQFAYAENSVIGFWTFNGDTNSSALIFIGENIEIGDTYILYNSNYKDNVKSKTEGNYTYFKGETSFVEVEYVDDSNILVSKSYSPPFPYKRMTSDEVTVFKKKYSDMLEKEAVSDADMERRSRISQSF